MNDTASNLTKLYHRLGLSTDSELITRRKIGVAKAADDLEIDNLPDLMLGLFKIGAGGEGAFLKNFEADPDFELLASDKEAVLLAAVIADHLLEDEVVGGPTALAIRSSSFGGLRPLEVQNDLLSRSDNVLAAMQEEESTLPSKRNKSPASSDLDAAIEAIEEVPANQFADLQGAIKTAFFELKGYIAVASQADANGHNRLRTHIERLEKETRTHWWVTGGWSAHGGKLFNEMPLESAIVFSALELQDQHDARLGLHAAPALLQLVLERKRKALGSFTIAQTATATELAFRKDRFGTLTTSANIGLYPLSAALALAADADDEDDWKATFRRKVGLEADQEVEALHIAVQLYHETLLRGLLGD